jgi:hypothetical protein
MDCAAVSGRLWQCARTEVCAQCMQSCAAFRLVVYGSARGSVWQCEWQCVAARTVVCAQCARQCAAVRLVVVYGGARGSVRLCSSGTVCGSVRQCATVLKAAMRGSARVHGSVSGSVWQRAR